MAWLWSRLGPWLGSRPQPQLGLHDAALVPVVIGL